ncbi:MAG: hypothetical protein ACOX2H_01625 [Saccharofermentanales bacterium]
MDNNQNKNNDNSEIKHNNKSDHSTIRRVNISFDDNEVPIKKDINQPDHSDQKRKSDQQNSNYNLLNNQNDQFADNSVTRTNLDLSEVDLKARSTNHGSENSSNDKLLTSNQKSENKLKSDPVGSNSKSVNDDTIVKEEAIRLNTESLKQYLKPEPSIEISSSDQDQETKSPWIIDQENGAKFYELIGYTTSSKIQLRFKREQRQSLLKRILITLILIIIIFLALYIIYPFKNFDDFKRIIGVKSMYGDIGIEKTVETDSEIDDQTELETDSEPVSEQSPADNAEIPEE